MAARALCIMWNGQCLSFKNRIRIGRLRESEICTNDGMVSQKHAVIANGVLRDVGSTNGTLVNGQMLKPRKPFKLSAGDEISCGQLVLRVEEEGYAGRAEFMRSKVFPGRAPAGGGGGGGAPGAPGAGAAADEDKKDADLTCEELMDQEFDKIVGHDAIKKQLRQFYKKVQLDKIRAKAGKAEKAPGLYHMLFMGPPGTGKTTLANLVAKMMLKMQLVKSDKVVFVNNALELLAGYSGQTPQKVDDKVAEAKGGVLFIDEAYSIVKKESKDGGFGKEAIDTIMKHMDPPSCVFIFAGYEKQMTEFLESNPGLARRTPYRYEFQAYTIAQLTEIFTKMCQAKREEVDEATLAEIPRMLESINDEQRETQNAGLVSNLVAFAQMERDDRVDIEEALANPALASLLLQEDVEKALVKVRGMQ